MHLALYRKYRPRTFDEVVGQTHITQTLKNQLVTGRSSHAYLFVGTRGTGKTSCAKLLARAMNCEHPQDGNPCNECAPCRSILDGSATDVMEIDAASNNGVENVRELRDEAVFSPAVTKKRVYIIDEVHMLSASAFNALLKILEEPPSHVVFILATTELHKVPATIVSRCQRYAFRRLPRELIAKQLIAVAGAENLTLPEDAAATLARLGDGSMRDALSLLDQTSEVAENGTLSLERIREAVGLPSRDTALALLFALAARDAADVFAHFDAAYANGTGAATLFDELAVLTRDALLSSIISADTELLSGAAEPGELRVLAEAFGTRRLIAFADLLTKTRGDFVRGAADRTTAELALISALRPDDETTGDATAKPIPETARIAAPPPSASKAPTSAPPVQPSAPEIPQPEVHFSIDAAAPAPKAAPAPRRAVTPQHDVIPPWELPRERPVGSAPPPRPQGESAETVHLRDDAPPPWERDAPAAAPQKNAAPWDSAPSVSREDAAPWDNAPSASRENAAPWDIAPSVSREDDDAPWDNAPSASREDDDAPWEVPAEDDDGEAKTSSIDDILSRFDDYETTED